MGLAVKREKHKKGKTTPFFLLFPVITTSSRDGSGGLNPRHEGSSGGSDEYKAPEGSCGRFDESKTPESSCESSGGSTTPEGSPESPDESKAPVAAKPTRFFHMIDTPLETPAKGTCSSLIQTMLDTYEATACDCGWCNDKDPDAPAGALGNCPADLHLAAVQCKARRAYFGVDISQKLNLSPWPDVVRVDRGRRSFFLHKDNAKDVERVKDTSRVLTSHDIGVLAGYLTPFPEKATVFDSVYYLFVDWKAHDAATGTTILLLDERVDIRRVSASDVDRRARELQRVSSTVEVQPYLFGPLKYGESTGTLTQSGEAVWFETPEDLEPDMVEVSTFPGMYGHSVSSSATCWHCTAFYPSHWPALVAFLQTH
jgi:hypothetical protein